LKAARGSTISLPGFQGGVQRNGGSRASGEFGVSSFLIFFQTQEEAPKVEALLLMFVGGSIEAKP
jgi:hypothetical protein